MKLFNLFLITSLTSFLLTACASSQATTLPTNTHTPTQINITSTEKPATPTFTPDPLTNAPEGATGKNEQTGEWIKTVEENGYIYEYVWNQESIEWMRLWGTVTLFDTPAVGGNYIPLRIYSDENTTGERAILDISYEDVISVDDANNPITRKFLDMLIDRYFPDGIDSNSQEWKDWLSEMKKGFDSEVFLSVITSSGELVQMRLSNETGFVLKIKDVLVGDDVSQWKGLNNTYYSRVTGIDMNGNIICEIASDIPIDQLNDEQIRLMFFACVGNVMTYESQEVQGNTPDGQVLAQNSAKTRLDGKPDLVINGVP